MIIEIKEDHDILLIFVKKINNDFLYDFKVNHCLYKSPYSIFKEFRSIDSLLFKIIPISETLPPAWTVPL